MSNYLLLGLPALLLFACADTSDRYRDLHELEMPPILPIEHTHTQTAVGADDLKPKTSALADLLAFTDDEHKPSLVIKTRPDRAWEMLMVAVKLCNLEVLDKNRQENRIQVRYDPDRKGKEPRPLDMIFNNDYAEAEYSINLKENTTGIAVLTALSKPDELEFGDDGSAELIRLLHKTIDEKIINRDKTKPEDD